MTDRKLTRADLEHVAAANVNGYPVPEPERRAYVPDEPMLIHQGQFTGRPSTIEVRPEPDGRLWVGGPVAPVASGRFHAHLT